MDKTDRLRDYGLAFLLYEQGLGVCGYELIRELFIFVKLILNSYLTIYLPCSTIHLTRNCTAQLLYLKLSFLPSWYFEFVLVRKTWESCMRLGLVPEGGRGDVRLLVVVASVVAPSQVLYGYLQVLVESHRV